jgi:hypothetical protein
MTFYRIAQAQLTAGNRRPGRRKFRSTEIASVTHWYDTARGKQPDRFATYRVHPASKHDVMTSGESGEC